MPSDVSAINQISPPGPDLPPSTQARLWLDAPIQLLESCRDTFGDAFTLNLGGIGPIVVLCANKDVAAVFQGTADRFESRDFNQNYRPIMGDNAIFLQDGAAHTRLRRAAMRALRAIPSAEHAAAAFDIAVAQRDRHAVDGVLPLRPFAGAVTLRVLAHLSFGAHAPEAEAFASAFETRAWTDLRHWKPWTAVARMRPELTAIIGARIETLGGAGSSPEGADLLSALLRERDADGAPLSRDEIVDQIMTFTVTAGDATGLALAWGLARLALTPAAQEKARAEAASCTAEALRDAPYLDAVFRETTRLHPVLPTISGRRLTAPMTLAGFDLPAGTTVAPCGYLAHRDPKVFDAPEAFRPERFLEARFKPSEFFPFGGGARTCIGNMTAPLTVKAGFAAVLRAGRLSIDGDALPRTVRLGTLLAPDPAAALRISPPDPKGTDT